MILIEFWTAGFQGRVSQIMIFLLYIHLTFFWGFLCFFSYNQHLFCGMKLSLTTNLVPNWVCFVLSSPESIQPINLVGMCTATINVLELGAFIAESQYFIPLFNHDFADNSQKGMKHQMGGATQAQQGMTFWITVIFSFLLFTMRTNQILCQVRT